jgi:hypothetical protein
VSVAIHKPSRKFEVGWWVQNGWCVTADAGGDRHTKGFDGSDFVNGMKGEEEQIGALYE